MTAVVNCHICKKPLLKKNAVVGVIKYPIVEENMVYGHKECVGRQNVNCVCGGCS